MKVIDYQKTDQGPVYSPAREIDTDKNPADLDVIARYNAFFQDVPLYGGQEWGTLPIVKIVDIFLRAAAEIEEVSWEVGAEK